MESVRIAASSSDQGTETRVDDADFIKLRDCWASQLKAASLGVAPERRSELNAGSPLSALVELIRSTGAKTGPRFATAAQKMQVYAGSFQLSLWPDSVAPDHDGASKRIAKVLGEAREGDAADWGSLFIRYAWEEDREGLLDIIRGWSPREQDKAIKERFLRAANTERLGAHAGEEIIQPKPVPKKGEGWAEALAIIETEALERTGSLDLSDVQIGIMPEQVAHLTWLERIDISGTDIASLGWLAPLERVEFLNISHTKITSLDAPVSCRSVTQLVCPHTGITDLDGLRRYANLVSLNCDFTLIKSLEGVEACEALNSLSCAHTGVRRLYSLTKLTELTELNVSHTDVQDIAGIEKLVNLRTFICSRSRIRSLAGIEGCNELRVLEAEHNALDSLDHLADLIRLRHVKLNFSHVAHDSEQFWLTPRQPGVFFVKGSVGDLPDELFSTDSRDDCFPRMKRHFQRRA